MTKSNTNLVRVTKGVRREKESDKIFEGKQMIILN